MELKSLFGFVFFLVVIFLLVFYWIIPFEKTDFGFKEINNNFNINDTGNNSLDYVGQFYSNMRFPTKEISYSINDCPLSKENDMENAFRIMSESTILSFYPSSENPEILVTCDSSTKIEGGLFIAGEGGPENVTKTSNFNVIFSGKILLLRESSCPKPNVAVHELLHVLGFNHSANKNNIMYPYSSCDQEIGDDIVNTINKLYSFPSYPDLLIENVSANMDGKYLNSNITIENAGLLNAGNSVLSIYADDKLVKEIDVNQLNIGYGRQITLRNILVLKLNIDSINFEINYPYDELSKENNAVILKIKNN